jgi:large subunit ribosomal protein L23
MDDKTMILRPRLSEKAFAASVVQNTYVIDVPGNANKHTVAGAVAAQFGVTVTTVRITNVKGKPKRANRKGGRPVQYHRTDIKKAYVTLKEGDKLPFFESPEEDAKADKKADKKEKK